MKKLKVEFFPSRCVGNGICASISPEYFDVKEKKAVLAGAEASGNMLALEKEFIDVEAEDVLEAARHCPTNAIKVTDSTTGNVLVSVTVDQESAREVVAEYDDDKEFVLDPEGYFLIRVDQERKNIEVGFCNMKNKVVLKVVGKKPIDIYQTIINKVGLAIRKDHCAYLGRELQKAAIALQLGIPYVQDDELNV